MLAREGGGRAGTVSATAETAGLARRVDVAVERAVAALLAQQRPHGFWQGTVESAPSLEAEYLLLLRVLARPRPELEPRLVERLRALQQPDGGWALGAGLPSHLSTSVEAYFALRLAGVPRDDPALVRCRELVQANGGLARVGTFTRFWLAAFGQFPREGVPSVPIELVLVPEWTGFGLGAFASWLRAPLVALGLLADTPPELRLPPDCRLDELWRGSPAPGELALPPPPRVVLRQRAFYALDRTLAALARSPWRPQRRRAVARGIEWLLRHQESTGLWAGLSVVTMPVLAALSAVGFALDHPAVQRGLQGLDDLLVQADGGLCCQPFTAPVWDTAHALRALLAAGLEPAHPAVERAAQWLCRQQVFRAGDWSRRAPGLDPGGWPLAAGSDWYPRVDATAAAVLALADTAVAATTAGRRAMAYGRQWIAGMQAPGGGWAAFDRGAPPRALDALPFPDLEGQSDPPCPDLTATALEVLGGQGFDGAYRAVREAVAWLERSQQPDGSWLGRWHVARVAGTAAVLEGLAAVGVTAEHPAVRRAVAWLAVQQNADGGFGESPRAYESGADARAESVPTQTARALLGLLAAGEGHGPAARAAVAFLLAAQQDDGGWTERLFAATGVPCRAYVRHQLDALHLPLRALARWRAAVTGGEVGQ